MITGPRLPSRVGRQAYDQRRIDLVLVECEAIAGGRVRDQIGAELGSDPGHQDLQRLVRVLGLLVGPESLDEPTGAASGAQVAREQGEQTPQPRSGDVAITVGHPRQQNEVGPHKQQASQTEVIGDVE